MKRKKEINCIERKLEVQAQGEEFRIPDRWRALGDPCEWINEDGSVELVSEEEFKKRGGILLSWGNKE